MLSGVGYQDFSENLAGAVRELNDFSHSSGVIKLEIYDAGISYQCLYFSLFLKVPELDNDHMLTFPMKVRYVPEVVMVTTDRRKVQDYSLAFRGGKEPIRVMYSDGNSASILR